MQNSSNGKRWFWGIFISLFIIAIIFAAFSFLILAKAISVSDNKEFDYEIKGSSNDKIAIIDLDFTILTSEPIIRQFKKYKEDKSVKGIVLNINSPGGGSAASHEIYEIVKKTRDEGKPIVSYFSSIAASGGYYVSCGTSYIVSNPSSLTGSIGVIAQFISYKELADKIGIKGTTIKSGKFKDSGNPFRELTKDDIDYFQEVINDTYELFLDVVSTERKIDKDQLRDIANGRVFTGRQALEYGLVDTLGTLDDAIKKVTELAKIDGEPSIIKERKKTIWIERFLEGITENPITDLKKEVYDEFLNKPILQYKFER